MNTVARLNPDGPVTGIGVPGVIAFCSSAAIVSTTVTSVSVAVPVFATVIRYANKSPTFNTAGAWPAVRRIAAVGVAIACPGAAGKDSWITQAEAPMT